VFLFAQRIWRLPVLKPVTVRLEKAAAHPMFRPIRKVFLTIVGLIVTCVGFLLIVLPGPAFLLIPIGLAILAMEYPFARRWLRKFQGWLTTWAAKADDFMARRKFRQN